MNSRVSLTKVCSFSLLIVLIFGQFIIFSKEAVNRPHHFFGDEPYYVSKALYLIQHGILPKADDKQAALGESWEGMSDFRPPGYPVFIALCNSFKFNIEHIRWRTSIIQFALMALVLVILYLIAFFALKGSKWLYLVAVILGFQPWAFEYVSSLYPDSLCASLTTISLIPLYMFIKTRKGILETIYILASSLLLCLTFMLRPEMIVLAPAIAIAALVIKSTRNCRVLKYVLFSGLIFLCFFSVQVGYRYYLTGKAELIPKYSYSNKGMVSWTGTWFNTEKNGMEIFGWLSAEHKMEKLPPYAFGDDYEKEEITKALSLKSVSGYTEEVDNIFQKIADKRIKDNPFFNCVLTRMWSTANLWLNLETNVQLLNALSSMPVLIRKIILAGFLLLKIFVYFLALVSFFLLIKALRAKTLHDYHYLTMLAMTNILLITIFIGFIFAECEHRYVLKAWPSMLWCAISAIIDLYVITNKQNKSNNI